MQQHNIDYLFWRIIACSAIAHIAMVVSFQSAPEPIPLNDPVAHGRFVQLIYVPTRVPPPTLKFGTNPLTLPITVHTAPHPGQRASKKPKRKRRRAAGHKRKTRGMGLLDVMQRHGRGGALFGKVGTHRLRHLVGPSHRATSPLLHKKVCFGANCASKNGRRGLGFGGGSFATCNAASLLDSCRSHYNRHGMHAKLHRPKETLQFKSHHLMITGCRSKAFVARTIRRYSPQIKQCYDRARQHKQALTGRITIRWIVRQSGKVSTVSVTQTTLRDKALEECMIRRISRWRFPMHRGDGRLVVNYPFIFTNQ